MHRDSTGAPYMILSMREWIESKERVLEADPEAKNLPFSDLYQRRIRAVAKDHGYDWDKEQRESLMTHDGDRAVREPAPDLGMEKA